MYQQLAVPHNVTVFSHDFIFCKCTHVSIPKCILYTISGLHQEALSMQTLAMHTYNQAAADGLQPLNTQLSLIPESSANC